MKKRFFAKVLAACGAAVLIGTSALPEAMAYFTTYVSAEGGYPVTLGNQTEIEETVSDMAKHIVIANTGETQCYVRVKVFGGSQFDIAYSGDAGWTLAEDGYWYYADALDVGGQTGELVAAVTVPEDYTQSFNIIVIQECTPVLYETDGTPYADWDRIADWTTDIGTGQIEGGVNP